jgi:hypothetical protein
VLSRFRDLVRRWPGLCVALALVAFASQGVAATLAWCLHDADGIHVTSAVEPCHTGAEGAVPASGEVPGHHAPHCHGLHAHPHGAGHTAHVSAATDASSGATPTLAASAAPILVLWQSSPVAAPKAEPGRVATASRWPGGDARPRFSGALPGVSTRLLI